METITITREQYRDVVKKCNNEFKNIVSIKDDKSFESTLITLVMTLQNQIFAANIEAELFGELEKTEKEGK